MKKGFTLIELLVVISIIGLLSSIVLVSLQGARVKAKIAKTQQEINAIMTSMYLYQGDKGELPPAGDNCSGCYDPCNSSWTAVVDALVSGGYLGERIDRDPWGDYFCYDDNDNVCCGPSSPFYSMGPNGRNDTYWGVGGGWTACLGNIMNGDDIGVRLPFGDRSCP